MIERKDWLHRIRAASKRRPIVWLSGVRRVGKTTLAKMLADATYLNCDLPSAQHGRLHVATTGSIPASAGKPTMTT